MSLRSLDNSATDKPSARSPTLVNVYPLLVLVGARRPNLEIGFPILGFPVFLLVLSLLKTILRFSDDDRNTLAQA